MRELAEVNTGLQGELVEYVQGLFVLRSVNRTGKRQERLAGVLEHLREVQRKDVLASVRPQLLISAFVQGGLLKREIRNYWQRTAVIRPCGRPRNRSSIGMYKAIIYTGEKMEKIRPDFTTVLFYNIYLFFLATRPRPALDNVPHLSYST